MTKLVAARHLAMVIVAIHAFWPAAPFAKDFGADLRAAVVSAWDQAVVIAAEIATDDVAADSINPPFGP